MASKILLKRSNVVDSSGNPKLPDASSMDYGELAINYAAGCETLSIKNSNNEIVKFSNGGISDAPQDGKYYARKDGAWEDVNSPILSILCDTNQSSHEDVSQVKVSVTYDDVSVQVQNGGTLDLIGGKTYTISFQEVENYKKPNDITFTVDRGGLFPKLGTYMTELITVTVSSEDSLSVKGQVVTINGESFTLTSSGIASKKIPFGASYSVSVNSKSGYMKPYD